MASYLSIVLLGLGRLGLDSVLGGGFGIDGEASFPWVEIPGSRIIARAGQRG